MIVAAWFAIITGAGMIFYWTAALASKQVPEIETEPLRILFHLVAEALTAIGLIVCGVALLSGFAWARPVYTFFAGMLAYTAIVSPGYFAQRKDYVWLLLFSLILLLDGAALWLLWR